MMKNKRTENRIPRRLAACVLCILMLLSACVTAPLSDTSSVWAETTGFVDTGNGVNLNVRSGPSTSYSKLFELSNGSSVTVLATENDADGGSIPWYKIECSKGTGYVRSDYITLDTGSGEEDPEFEAYLEEQGFPESYRVPLRRLHAAYPEWKFVAKHTELNWTSALARETRPGVSLVEDTAADPWIQFDAYGNMTYYDSGYVQASKAAVAFYMDPRNGLSSKAVFQFLSDKFDADTQTIDGLRGVISTSFLSKPFPDGGYDSYADLLMYAGITYNVNPLTLASKIILEQGWSGSSDSISGTVPGYVGLYNHFNIGAYAANGYSAIENGLIYARKKGWTSRTRSILGGSSWFAAEFVNVGQYSLYYQRWNVLNGLSNVGTGQYMTAVHGSYSTALTKANGYTDSTGQLKNEPLTFEIPVYLEMPANPCPVPGTAEFDFTLDCTSKTIPAGSTYGFLAKLTDKSLGAVTVTSSDSDVATAYLKNRDDSRGFYFELTGHKQGSAVITVTYGGISRSLSVTVFDYVLDCTTKSVPAGTLFGFLAKLTDKSYGTPTVYSSDPDVATVYLDDAGDSRGFYFEGEALSAGTAVITITYAGIAKALTVNVTEPSKPDPETHRIAGVNRYETAIDAAETLKSLKGAELFDSIIVADGRNYPDALAGSFLAAKISSSGASPVLLVNPATESYMVEYIQANLAEGGTVYVLGGAGAVSENFTALLEEAGINCSRLAGPNRYETNLAILEAVCSASSGSFVICSGTSFADSLSASSLGLPLMLAGRSLTDAQLAFLASHAGGTCYIVGGTGAVSEYVESQIRALGLATERVAGKDRMRTSLAVAERFFGSAEKAVLAYAFNYPDGLTGSAVAFQLGAPILLTDSSSTYTARRFVRYRTAVVTDVYVMGGSALISDAALEAICGTR